jgi:hypothetical protein
VKAIEDINPAHRPPRGVRDWLSYSAVYATRMGFDLLTSYGPNKHLNRDQWLFRFVFLETVAGNNTLTA